MDEGENYLFIINTVEKNQIELTEATWNEKPKKVAILHNPMLFSTPDIITTENKFLNRWINERPYFWGVFTNMVFQYIMYLFFMCVYQENKWWKLFGEKAKGDIYYFTMSFAMVAGAFIAGSTPEGGGAVAYPVMTILLHLPSNVGRDFSLMIQSFGMTSASLTILYSRIKVDPDVVLSTSLGGFALIPYLKWLAPKIPGPHSKTLFVTYYLTFIALLFYINLKHRKILYQSCFCNWPKRIFFFVFGALGAAITSLAGTGIDTVVYQVMVLGFGLHEKVGNPTCVLIMGINTVVGFFAQAFVWQTLSPTAVRFLIVALPVVVILAPVGAFVNSVLNRYFILALVFLLDLAQFIMFFAYNPEGQYGITAVVTFVSAAILVGFMAWVGLKYSNDSSQPTATEWEDLNPVAKFLCWKVMPFFFIMVPYTLLYCVPLVLDIDQRERFAQ